MFECDQSVNHRVVVGRTTADAASRQTDCRTRPVSDDTHLSLFVNVCNSFYHSHADRKFSERIRRTDFDSIRFDTDACRGIAGLATMVCNCARARSDNSYCTDCVLYIYIYIYNGTKPADTMRRCQFDSNGDRRAERRRSRSRHVRRSHRVRPLPLSPFLSLSLSLCSCLCCLSVCLVVTIARFSLSLTYPI